MAGKMKDGSGCMMCGCDCMHHAWMPRIMGIMLLLFGLGWYGFVAKVSMYGLETWFPLLLALGGLMKIVKGRCTCCEHPMG